MPSFFRNSLILVIGLAAMAGAARADEEMDLILDGAMPFMHHSCESMINNYGVDEKKVADIVRLMVAVSLYNREIDIEKAIPDEDLRATLKDEFVAALEKA